MKSVLLLVALVVVAFATDTEVQPLASSDKKFEIPEGMFTSVAHSADSKSAKKCSCTMIELKKQEDGSIHMKGTCMNMDKKLYTFEKVATPVKDQINTYNVEKTKAQLDGQDVMKDTKKKASVWKVLHAGEDYIALQNQDDKNAIVLARTSKIPELKSHLEKLPALAASFGVKDLKVTDVSSSCKDLESKVHTTDSSKEETAKASGMDEGEEVGTTEEGRRRKDKVRKQLDIPAAQRLYLVATAEPAFASCKCPTLDLKLRSQRMKNFKAVDFHFNCMNQTNNEVISILGVVRKDRETGKHVAKALKKMINGKETELSENEKKEFIAEKANEIMILHSDKTTSFAFLNDTKASVFSTDKQLKDNQKKVFDTVFLNENIKLTWIPHEAAVCDAVYPKLEKKSIRSAIRERRERLRRDEDTDDDTDSEDDD